MHPLEFDEYDNKVREIISQEIFRKFTTQKGKLEKLTQKPSTNTRFNQINKHVFGERTINLTDVVFNNKELNLLNKGTKYAPKIPFKNQLETLVVDTATALSDHTNQLTTELVKKTLTEIPIYKCSVDTNTIKTIQNKIKENNLVSTRADKGNATVLLKKQDYINKVADFFQKEKIQRLTKDPTAKFQLECKNGIKKATGILNDRDKLRLIEMNPKPPVLYGLVKVHKD